MPFYTSKQLCTMLNPPRLSCDKRGMVWDIEICLVLYSPNENMGKGVEQKFLCKYFPIYSISIMITVCFQGLQQTAWLSVHLCCPNQCVWCPWQLQPGRRPCSPRSHPQDLHCQKSVITSIHYIITISTPKVSFFINSLQYYKIYITKNQLLHLLQYNKIYTAKS